MVKVHSHPPKILPYILRYDKIQSTNLKRKNERNAVILHVVIIYIVAEARRLVMLLRRFFPLLSNCQADLRKARNSIKVQDLGKGGAASTLVGSAFDCLHPFPTSLHKPFTCSPPRCLWVRRRHRMIHHEFTETCSS